MKARGLLMMGFLFAFQTAWQHPETKQAVRKGLRFLLAETLNAWETGRYLAVVSKEEIMDMLAEAGHQHRMKNRPQQEIGSETEPEFRYNLVDNCGRGEETG